MVISDRKLISIHSEQSHKLHTCKMPRTVFIVGAPRSGTTLILNMLAVGQSRIGGVPRESKFYSKFIDQRREHREYIDHLYFKMMFSGPAEVEQLLEGSDGPSDFFQKAIRLWCSRHNKEVFVEKSPQHIFKWKRIKQDFPDALFLVVRREPLANIHSLVATDFVSNPADRIPFGLGRFVSVKYLGAALKYESYQRALNQLLSNCECLEVSYDDIVQEKCNFRNVLSDYFGFRLDPLYVRRPFSSQVSHKRYEIDKSRVAGYRDSMPRGVQTVLNRVYNPVGLFDRLFSFLVKGCLFAPFNFLDRLRRTCIAL